jgi:hypothetical protein
MKDLSYSAERNVDAKQRDEDERRQGGFFGDWLGLELKQPGKVEHRWRIQPVVATSPNGGVTWDDHRVGVRNRREDQ